MDVHLFIALAVITTEFLLHVGCLALLMATKTLSISSKC
jgi:hypothetical protein